MINYHLLISFFLVITFSCNTDDHIRTYRIPKKRQENSVAQSIIKNNDLILKWEKPDNWIEVTGHSMRLVSFRVPCTNGFGDLSITSFDGKSGSINSNVNRWLGQIGLNPKVSEEIADLTQMKNGELGQFLFFKLINHQKEEKAILAAIYTLEDRTIFIKLMSEFQCLLANEIDFTKFCESLSLVRK